MRITVIGGGSIGTLMAAEMLKKGHKVTIYTSRPDEWKNEITVLLPTDKVLFRTAVYRVTDSMEEALYMAELVFITMPAQLFRKLSPKMEPYVLPGMRVRMVPGSGGAEFAFRNLLGKGCVLFGFQRVHSIARIKEYGKSVYMLGRKSEIYIGAIPADSTGELCPVMESLFELPCMALANYLCVTLTPSNPILHTARLYSMFREYEEGIVYPRNYLFYEEWDDEASRTLFDCDHELQNLCAAIPMELVSVKSLREHYESSSVSAMTQKIRSIQAFKGLTSPMKRIPEGWIPDFESRYFTADFAYGLKVIRDTADLFGVPTPDIDSVWRWYERVNPENAAGSFRTDINRDDFVKLYG